jgi:hypothetical protein
MIFSSVGVGHSHRWCLDAFFAFHCLKLIALQLLLLL